MHFRCRNVNEAFRVVVDFFDSPYNNRADELIQTKTSRNGPVKKLIEPVTITYQRPRERVLFNPARDCNPFFHVFEALWMLSGSNSLEPLLKYVSTFGDYSDDGKTLNGAYGHRWRRACVQHPPSKDGTYPESVGIIGNQYWLDQLKILIQHLRENPDSRRAVLQMWDVENDLVKIDNQFDQYSRDVCCNLSACFSIRDEGSAVDTGGQHPDGTWITEWEEYKLLDMTVFNRSNDAIYGMFGADEVHFSFLQEYVANCLGVSVGQYHQISSDLHIYTETNSGFHSEKWLAPEHSIDFYQNDVDPCPIPLVSDPAVFDEEVQEFVYDNDFSRNWYEPFLQHVANPMCWAFELHKRRDYRAALMAIEECQAEDWKLAAVNWLKKRQKNWESK